MRRYIIVSSLFLHVCERYRKEKYAYSQNSMRKLNSLKSLK